MTADTRAKILQAAFFVLSRQGYENTSIKEIAEEAGVAQGLVHYYFKSKQHLVLAVLDEVCRVMKLYPVQGEAGARNAYDTFKTLLKDNRDTHALYLQLIAVGLHDREVGAGVLNFLSEDRAHIEELARQVLAEREVDPTPARGIAAVIEAAKANRLINSALSSGGGPTPPMSPFDFIFKSDTLMVSDPAYKDAVTASLEPIHLDPRINSLTSPYTVPPSAAQSLTSRDGHEALVLIQVLGTGQQANNTYSALRSKA